MVIDLYVIMSRTSLEDKPEVPAMAGLGGEYPLTGGAPVIDPYGGKLTQDWVTVTGLLDAKLLEKNGQIDVLSQWQLKHLTDFFFADLWIGPKKRPICSSCIFAVLEMFFCMDQAKAWHQSLISQNWVGIGQPYQDKWLIVEESTTDSFFGQNQHFEDILA